MPTPSHDYSAAKSLDYIRQQIQSDAAFNALSREAAIVFADLVGTTEFKRHHSAIAGLHKTLVHNAIVCDAIQAVEGNVVKHLGDGVMCVFEGDGAARRAIEAGLAVIQAIEEGNQSQGWNHFPQSMSTKLGVSFGKVWFLQFPNSTEIDPQGTVVDVAARVTGLAGPQQLVCTDEAYRAATLGEDDLNGSVGEATQRLIKGSNELVSLRCIAPPSRTPGEILISGHRRPTPDHVLQLLFEANKAMRAGRNDEAMGALTEVVENDPGNFEANFRAAEILLHKRSNSRGEERETLDRIIQHLSLAKQTRPESSRVWYLASWTRAKRFELLRDMADLERAIQFAEISLARAEELMDFDGTVQAKICLARQLVERSEWVTETDPTDLARATELCEEVRAVVKERQQSLLADYMITHALVRLRQKDTDYEGVRMMLEEAQSIDPANHELLTVEAKLRDARYEEPIR